MIETYLTPCLNTFQGIFRSKQMEITEQTDELVTVEMKNGLVVRIEGGISSLNSGILHELEMYEKDPVWYCSKQREGRRLDLYVPLTEVISMDEVAGAGYIEFWK